MPGTPDSDFRLRLQALLADARPLWQSGVSVAEPFAEHVANGMRPPQHDVLAGALSPVVGVSRATIPILSEYTRRLQHALIGSRDPHVPDAAARLAPASRQSSRE